MRLSEEIKKLPGTIYQQVAGRYGVTVEFVGKIARGERKAIRGKGLEIKKELESIIK